MDGDDAGMIDFSGDARFANQGVDGGARFPRRSAGIDRITLIADRTAYGRIAGVIDDAHGAPAKLARIFVSADACRIRGFSNPPT